MKKLLIVAFAASALVSASAAQAAPLTTPVYGQSSDPKLKTVKNECWKELYAHCQDISGFGGFYLSNISHNILGDNVSGYMDYCTATCNYFNPQK